MADLLSQLILLDLDDVNDIEIKKFGSGYYELRIGDIIAVCKTEQDLKTCCLNIQSAYEKFANTINETFNGVLESFKAGAK